MTRRAKTRKAAKQHRRVIRRLLLVVTFVVLVFTFHELELLLALAPVFDCDKLLDQIGL